MSSYEEYKHKLMEDNQGLPALGVANIEYGQRPFGLRTEYWFAALLAGLLLIGAGVGISMTMWSTESERNESRASFFGWLTGESPSKEKAVSSKGSSYGPFDSVFQPGQSNSIPSLPQAPQLKRFGK